MTVLTQASSLSVVFTFLRLRHCGIILIVTASFVTRFAHHSAAEVDIREITTNLTTWRQWFPTMRSF